MSDYLDLYDYRCRVAEMYRTRRQATLDGEDSATVLQRFRQSRDELFAKHSQSALDQEQKRQSSIFISTHGRNMTIGRKTAASRKPQRGC